MSLLSLIGFSFRKVAYGQKRVDAVIQALVIRPVRNQRVAAVLAEGSDKGSVLDPDHLDRPRPRLEFACFEKSSLGPVGALDRSPVAGLPRLALCSPDQNSIAHEAFHRSSGLRGGYSESLAHGTRRQPLVFALGEEFPNTVLETRCSVPSGHDPKIVARFNADRNPGPTPCLFCRRSASSEKPRPRPGPFIP